MQIKSSILSMVVIGGLLACTSVPVLPKAKALSTEASARQYFYCESCAKATPLTKDVYQPLEPDVPVVVVEPLVKPAVVPPVKHTVKKYHKRRHKKRVHHHKPNQCIQWSNKK